MLIFGWGKKSKKIADVGLMTCRNCMNVAGAEVRELSNKASLYFVPVAKWNKKYYLVCPVCDAGFELDEKSMNELLASVANLPSNEVSIKIYNDVIDFFNNCNDDPANNLNKIMTDLEQVLKDKGYKEDDMRYVVGFFVDSISSKFDK
ncbi:MAG: zinc-ribbon domain-containing protein [Candidatus Komeilibacteria bacterium]